ncbi:MAG TPA: hypothetical protein VG983_04700 [Caulobacterales bacterium]|nr:hypothetical protein [Caulobacterales bacterium]
MRIVELTPARLIVEDKGTGFGIVCVLAGHGVVLLALAKPPFHLWLQVLEISLGVIAAAYGAVLLTKTRTLFDRIRGEIVYERRNFFHSRVEKAYFYEIEEVILLRGPRDIDPFRADPTQSYTFRPALKVRRETWPLARMHRDHRTAAHIAQTIRGVLDEFAMVGLRRMS